MENPMFMENILSKTICFFQIDVIKVAIENQSPINKINGQLSIGKQLKPSINERVSIFHCHVGVLVVQVDGRHQASPTPTLPTPGWSFSGGIPS